MGGVLIFEFDTVATAGTDTSIRIARRGEPLGGPFIVVFVVPTVVAQPVKRATAAMTVIFPNGATTVVALDTKFLETILT
jgi:hypothetical protein